MNYSDLTIYFYISLFYSVKCNSSISGLIFIIKTHNIEMICTLYSCFYVGFGGLTILERVVDRRTAAISL